MRSRRSSEPMIHSWSTSTSSSTGSDWWSVSLSVWVLTYEGTLARVVLT